MTRGKRAYIVFSTALSVFSVYETLKLGDQPRPPVPRNLRYACIAAPLINYTVLRWLAS